MTYEVAKIEDYGFKEHKFLKILWKVLKVVIIVLTIVMLYSSIFMIALQSFNASKSTTEFTHFTFDWYKQMFSNRLLNQAIKNTFTVSILATLISTVLGTLIAIGIFYLPQKARQKILLFSMVLGIFPYFFGLPTLLLAHIFFTLPYIILSVIPKLKEMDPNTMDAAQDLGLKPLKSIWKVIVPAVKSGIFSGLVLAFTISFEDFAVSYFTTGNGFDNMSIWIYSSIGKRSLFPGVYAFSTLLTLGSMIFVVCKSLINKKDKGSKRK